MALRGLDTVASGACQGCFPAYTLGCIPEMG